MKTLLINMPWQKVLFIGIMATLSFAACKKDKKDNVNPIQKTTIQLSGANEVPVVTSNGTGSAALTYDPATKMLSYQISWQLGNPSSNTTGMHFHGAENGSPAISSDIVIPIDVTSFSGSSGTLSGSTPVLTDTQIAQLLNGKWYLNIHSSVYPNGEMRGNINFGTNPNSNPNPNPNPGY